MAEFDPHATSDLAQMLGGYLTQLVEQGFSRHEALAIVMAYQASILSAVLDSRATPAASK